MFESLIDAGAEYIQVDEPILVTDDSESYENITREAYDYFEEAGIAKKLVNSNILRTCTSLNS
ncbi:hypothetical protein ACVPOS_01075 [Staphylococcus aureus]